jgi:hypothetical protein
MPAVENDSRLGHMGVLSSACITSGAFTPDSVVERRPSDAAHVHSNRRISSTSLGDPTVPDSFTRQLPRNQQSAMVTDTPRRFKYAECVCAFIGAPASLTIWREHGQPRWDGETGVSDKQPVRHRIDCQGMSVEVQVNGVDHLISIRGSLVHNC